CGIVSRLRSFVRSGPDGAGALQPEPEREADMPRRHRVSIAAATLAALLAGAPRAARAQDDWAPDRAEPGSVDRIRTYTTAPDYLPRSVAYVPDSDRVPSPTKGLGHLVGAPDELSTVAQIHAYFRKLDAASDRVRVEKIGTSEEGREILLVFVSSEANLARLE